VFDVYEEYETLRRMFLARLHDKSLTMVVEIEADVPRQLRVDGRKLRQILINLIGNAVKFTHEGGIILRIAVKDFAIDKPFLLHVEVEDSGVGIPAEEMDRLFVPFVQTSSGQNLQSGTGLGLSISHRYVSLMGGELTAVSTPTISTIFKFDVLVTAVNTPDTPSPPQPVAAGEIIGLAADQPEIRLLIAEDNDASRFALLDLLEDIGFVIHGVANGKEAVAEWARWQPHLIWMDTRMPIMSGREAVKKIRAESDGQNVIIIALTADALLDIEELAADGYNDCLFKPFQLDDLLRKIGQHLPVTYIHAAAVIPTTVPKRKITAVDLQGMPAEWVSEMHQAAMQGRAEQVLSLIDKIDETNFEMAQQLSYWVETFQFDEIAALTTA
jgi:two-component system sensor histidine kinase/response regulator